MIEQHQTAGVAAITSGVSTISTFALVNEIAQFIAALVAIASGLAATYYYIVKARRK